jgi:hypothetical protein
LHEEGTAVAKPTRALARGITAIFVLLLAHRVDATPQREVDALPGAAGARVRTEDHDLSALIRLATDRSPTFRGIVNAIQESDGIVYVQRDRCRHYVRSCLVLWMGFLGPYRVLRVNVAGGKNDIETMASIAHELRHALEVLSEPGVRSSDGMYQLYTRNHAWRGETFETAAAIDAGNAVYKELKRSLQN